MKSAEEKVRFRNHFLKLAQGRLFAHDHPSFWKVLWQTPSTADDVFQVLQPHDIRAVRDLNRPNFAVLIRLLSKNIIAITDGDTSRYPSPTTVLLNSIRLLSRVLPFLFELENYYSEIEPLVFWDAAFNPGRLVSGGDTIPKFNLVAPSAESKTTLALDLVAALLRCCFIRGFTITAPTSSSDPNVFVAIWEPGIGSQEKPRPQNYSTDSNRLDVVRCLLVLISAPFYGSRETLASQGSRFLTLLVALSPRKELLTLLYSLINVVCRGSNSGRDGQGISLLSLRANEAHNLYLSHCAQLLAHMVAYPIPSTEHLASLIDHKVLSSASLATNRARLHLSKLTGDDDLTFLASNLLRILQDSVNGILQYEKNTFSISRVRPGLIVVEAISVFWELVQCNSKFKNLVVRAYTNQVFVSLLLHIVTFGVDDSCRSLCEIAAYCMLYFSADPLLTRKIMFPLDVMFFKTIPASSQLTPRPRTMRDFLVTRIASFLCDHSPAASRKLKIMLVQTMYNLISLVPDPAVFPIKASVPLRNADPRGGLSYGACYAITNLISAFSTRTFLRECVHNADLLALLLRALCACAIRNHRPLRFLLYSFLKNEKIYRNILITMADMEKVSFSSDGTLVDKDLDAMQVLKEAADESIDPPLQRPDSPSDQSSLISEAASPNMLSLSSNDPLAPPVLENDQSCDWDRALMAQLPLGMSDSAREKLPMFCSVARSWGGGDALRIILTIILPCLKLILQDMWSPGRAAVADSEKIAIKIDESELGELVLSNRGLIPHEFTPSAPASVLAFRWNHLSLGWYLSLVYEQVYLAGSKARQHSDGNKVMRNITSSIVSVSKITLGWTNFIKTGGSHSVSESEHASSRLEACISDTEPWTSTRTVLFALEPSKRDSVLSTTLTRLSSFGFLTPPMVSPTSGLHIQRRVSDLRSNGGRNSTGSFEDERPRPVTRNSIGSFHSLNNINRTRTSMSQGEEERPRFVSRNSTSSFNSINNINRSRANMSQADEERPPFVTRNSTSSFNSINSINRARTNNNQGEEERPRVVTRNSASSLTYLSDVNLDGSNTPRNSMNA